MPEPCIYTLRIDLLNAKPPIWRRIEVRSDVSLQTLHIIIQAAFDWFDYHLYQFALGEPFDYRSELFLCDYDAEEDPEEGLSVRQVRLDETLQEPRDLLAYVYDYGDNWRLRIRLEKVREASPGDPTARCIDGRRAAPPEDCGSLREAEELAEVLDDPAFFDVSATDADIQNWLGTPEGFVPAHLLTEEQEAVQEIMGRFPQFRQLIDALDTPFESDARAIACGDIVARLRSLLDDPEPANVEPIAGAAAMVETDDATTWQSFHPIFELLSAASEGTKLTAAGYLPPAIADRVADVLGLESFERSTGGESKMRDVFGLRTALQKAGLLRKTKGTLVLTNAGKSVLSNPGFLWNHLVTRMLPKPVEPRSRDFVAEGTLLVLLTAATAHGELDLSGAARAMTLSGWRIGDQDVDPYHLWNMDIWQAEILRSAGPREQPFWIAARIAPQAVWLARASLLSMPPVPLIGRR